MKKRAILLLAPVFLALIVGCVTHKKKGEDISGFKKGYHNLTSRYNYWFNADELIGLTTAKMEAQYKDNFNQLLEIYPATAADPQAFKSDLDNIIKKSSTAIALHRPSDWTDDCYNLVGQAQYYKRDFETAEATFQFIRDELNPNKTTPKKLKSGSDKKKKSAGKKKKSPSKKKKKSSKKKKKKSSSSKKSSDKSKTSDKKTPSKSDGKSKKEAAKTDELTLVGKNPYDKGLKRIAAYPSAMIWYGRTLTERDKYDEADFLYRSLWEDPWFPPSLKKDLATAEAYLWIKQRQYDKAIAPLEKAIGFTKRKKDRARLAFILAQINDRAGRHEASYAAFETVLRSNPGYEMEFNARLKQIQAGWTNGKIKSAEARKSLERMLNDDKNADHLDQLYYALGEIALAEGQKDEAIGFLRKSLDNNKNNQPQRVESYLKLADLYFGMERFVEAKNYFDSTLIVLPETDDRRARVTQYASNLSEIARLITLIAANDSIVRIYRMSPDERKDLAKKIRKQKEEELAAANKAATVSNTTPKTSSFSSPIQVAAPQAGNAVSSFPLYNDAFLKKGRKEFNRVWGERKLEDNWRRSNRPATAAEGDPVTAANAANAADTDSGADDLFKGIPRSEAELSVLHLATYDAMYNLGALFRDRLQNNKRCAGTLEDMLGRYPDTTKYQKESWYYCYLAFSDLANKPKAQYYLDRLVEKYPSSTYARALTDPNFVNSGKARDRELNAYYEQTYGAFQAGDYKNAYQLCQEAPKKYGATNPLRAKFALLSALCVGSIDGGEAYCKALSEVIANFPETAESVRAKEVARLLGCKGFEVAEQHPKNTAAEMEDPFTREDDKLHYFLAVLTGKDVKVEELKNAISDYNRENHKTEQLRISSIYLGVDTEQPIIVIRKFDNKDQAMKYYNEVKNKKDFLGENNKKSYNKEFFAITQENYRRVLKNKTLNGYRDFFQENYLQ